MKRNKIKKIQYIICCVLFIWGAIDSLIQFVRLVTNPAWSASYSAPLLWFLIIYFVPVCIIFFIFEIIIYIHLCLLLL